MPRTGLSCSRERNCVRFWWCWHCMSVVWCPGTSSSRPCGDKTRRPRFVTAFKGWSRSCAARSDHPASWQCVEGATCWSFHRKQSMCTATSCWSLRGERRLRTGTMLGRSRFCRRPICCGVTTFSPSSPTRSSRRERSRDCWNCALMQSRRDSIRSFTLGAIRALSASSKRLWLPNRYASDCVVC